jgi:hypothetical protein
VDVIWLDFGLKVEQIRADFCQTLKTNLTQHGSHGPDDHPKTIDYYHRHLDMSRDDDMDEHEVIWLCGCHLVGFWLGS